MKRLALVAAVALILSGCATVQSVRPLPPIMMGSAVCGREAMKIYFGNQDDILSITAAQVVSELSNKLARCPDRKVILVAVSGNDGAPATPRVAANRVKVVGDILISQGLNPAKITSVVDGPYVDAMPRGPIGGVAVMTQPSN